MAQNTTSGWSVLEVTLWSAAGLILSVTAAECMRLWALRKLHPSPSCARDDEDSSDCDEHGSDREKTAAAVKRYLDVYYGKPCKIFDPCCLVCEKWEAWRLLFDKE